MAKKTFLSRDDEIDLVDVLEIIWNGKIKKFLITLIFFLIATVYYIQIPKNYMHSLTIKKANESEFWKVSAITKNNLNR